MSSAEKRNGRHRAAVGPHPASTRRCRYPTYGLIAVAELVKVVISEVPTNCTAVIITTAMPAAIRPYSMAVAPDSLLRKRETKLSMEASTCKLHPIVHGMAARLLFVNIRMLGAQS